ncbi:UNVERIFIED_CONTAM: ParE-like toxin of type II ParDE toxin-antitoxin system [Acetivibrio alkalicellulosi]
MHKVAVNVLIGNIEERVMQLEGFPFSCNNVSDEVLKTKGYRKLIAGNYLVFYILDEKNEKVVIVSNLIEHKIITKSFKKGLTVTASLHINV